MKERLFEMISEIERDLQNLQELRSELEGILSDSDIIARRAKGSILHDFYNVCERIFKKISIDMNGGYEDTDRWHKNLLYRMTIAVERLRPAVVSEELAADLDEFLAFRHLFRNIYGFELKGNRIEYLSGKFIKVADKFEKEIRGFIQILKKEISDKA